MLGRNIPEATVEGDIFSIAATTIGKFYTKYLTVPPIRGKIEKAINKEGGPKTWFNNKVY